MLVVVGRGVITGGPHSGARKSLKLNLTPHASSVCLCAAVAYRGFAAWPQRRQKVSGEPAGRQTHWGQQFRYEVRRGGPAADAGEPERRWKEPERSGGAGGQLLTARPVGPLTEQDGAGRPIGSSLG